MTATARQCAAEILRAVMDEKRPLDEALMRHSTLGQLAERDRAFTRLMLMTVLRRRGQIDRLLAQLLQKPLTGKTTDVMHVLRLGLAQLLWLETPPHAAVHAMVETVAAMGHQSMKGLVNAVLKRASKEGAAMLAARNEAAENLPSWLYDSWRKAYGEEKTQAIAEAGLQEPPLDISVKEDAQDWADKLGGELLFTGSVRLTRAGRIEELPGYAEGAWWVQDAAATLPVQLLGDVSGLRVLDLCAAPGGKTAQLCARGADVTAVDKSARRLKLLARNLERLQLNAKCVESDVLRYRPEEPFDAVLLDAPCSATGTLRRHPEAAWNKTQGDVIELAQLQKRLLTRVAQWVKPGGRLVYCVCSLQPEEGEMQAEAFLSAHPEFEVHPAEIFLSNHGIINKKGAVRTHPAALPGKGGMDGFYAVSWQRLKYS